jgi:hypothetical protein
MPTITLRRIREDLASKLDQLEARAAVLEQHAQNSSPAAALRPPARPLARLSGLQATLAVGLRIIRRFDRLIRIPLSWVARTAYGPSLAFAARVVRGSFNGAAICLALACAMLLVWALAVAVVAPPD